jgi:hypothetical protein
MKTSQSGEGSRSASDRIDYLKGNKLRMDLSVDGEPRSIIVDLDADRLIWLVPQARMAHIVDLRTMASDMASFGPRDLNASITATSRTRQIAGATCTVHDLKLALPLTAPPPTTLVLAGSACLAKDGPGAADVSAFYRAATEKGLFFGDPYAPTEIGHARLMTAMYREFVDRGIPFATELKPDVELTGAMAELMKQMGKTPSAPPTTKTEVVSISTAAIPPSTFEVPAGYEIVK